jgi:DNA-binding PadR family transcriptional regulator
MRWVRRDMYAWNAGGGEEIRTWWTWWDFHELPSSGTPNKKEMSEERVEARASKAGLYVEERTLSLAFAVKPSSSTLKVDT